MMVKNFQYASRVSNRPKQYKSTAKLPLSIDWSYWLAKDGSRGIVISLGTETV